MELKLPDSSSQTVLFAGGGTGGHIFPNLAVVERLPRDAARAHLLLSDRPLDAEIARKAKLDYTALPAKPLIMRPKALLAFYRAFRVSERQIGQLIEQLNAKAIIATGGFVAGPAITAARKAGLPVAMVNLDAVPGKANRVMARRASEVFSAYPNRSLAKAQHIGLPLRRSALASDTRPEDARRYFRLDPDRKTIFVTAGSQGARTVNEALMELAQRTEPRKVLADWQLLHLCGPGGDVSDRDIQKIYNDAGLRARVLPFCNTMGKAWAAATIAVSRAGAGSVAEVWANAVPTIFLPYPYHKDEHQKHNCAPLVDAGAAMLLRDQIDPMLNAPQLFGPLKALMTNDAHRDAMRDKLRQTQPMDGALVLADWLRRKLNIDVEAFARGLQDG